MAKKLTKKQLLDKKKKQVRYNMTHPHLNYHVKNMASMQKLNDMISYVAFNGIVPRKTKAERKAVETKINDALAHPAKGIDILRILLALIHRQDKKIDMQATIVDILWQAVSDSGVSEKDFQKANKETHDYYKKQNTKRINNAKKAHHKYVAKQKKARKEHSHKGSNK